MGAALLPVVFGAVLVASCNGSSSRPETRPLSPAIEEVLAQVSALRGLPPPGDVRAGAVPRADVREVLADSLSSEDREAFKDLTDLYRLLGFIGPTDDYEKLYLDFASRALIGFYEPSRDDLWIVEGSGALDFESFDPILRSTVAHELVHALQDHRFGLPALLKESARDLDWSLALSAVIEGDAVHYERLWAAEHLSGTPSASVGVREVLGGSITAALERELRFPYEAGLDWTALAGAANDNVATKGVLEGRRITTAEILHPQLAASGWRPAEVQLPNLEPKLEKGWKRSSSGSFGEFRLRNLLQLHLRGLPAVGAAAGWAGDHYDLYRSGQDSVAVLAVAFAAREEAAEFTVALSAWFQASGATVRTGVPTSAELPDGRTVIARNAGDTQVILIFGSNAIVAADAAALLEIG